jgi:hypothetical protein
VNGLFRAAATVACSKLLVRVLTERGSWLSCCELGRGKCAEREVRVVVVGASPVEDDDMGFEEAYKILDHEAFVGSVPSSGVFR